MKVKMRKVMDATGRALRFEVVTRMREDQQAAKETNDTARRRVHLIRQRAFDEVYTHIKGMKIGEE